MVATVEQRNAFIDQMIEFAAPVAVANDLPAAALVACGGIESGYGTSKIYDKHTHCPFNLQKPKSYDKWVHCDVVWLTTLSKMDASGHQSNEVRAPFCKAVGDSEQTWLADAARIWCEWILGWPDPVNNAAMKALRQKPLEFAKNLHRVGFGDRKVANLTAKTYEDVFREQRLIERCAGAKPKAASMPVPVWLPGWWVVTWRGQTYYYHFDKLLGAAWTPFPPINALFAVVGARDLGRVTVTSPSEVSVVWNGTGAVEKFVVQPGTPQAMAGTWRGVEPLKAQRWG